jgi:hypothetical protein
MFANPIALTNDVQNTASTVWGRAPLNISVIIVLAQARMEMPAVMLQPKAAHSR